MASDNSSLEIVHRRGSHFVVHLAPELRQGKHFYLEALCIRVPLPLCCHCHGQWWPPHTRKPGHSGLALQLPWDSTWPGSSFWGLVFWAVSPMSLVHFLPTLRRFFSPQPHTLSGTSSSGIGFIFLLATCTWLGPAVLAPGHRALPR